MERSPQFFVAGGNVPPDAPCYVERQADSDLLAALRAGETCHVLDTRQVGKSSLMARAAARLRREGVRVAALDLTGIGWNVTPEQWYAGLAAQAGASLGDEDAAEEAFAAGAGLGPAQRFFAVLEGWVRDDPRPLAVFVDEIDAVRSLPFSTDEFFAGIRACHNRRAERPELGRLAFCLAGSATPESLVRDPRATPFNIGERIEPSDFTPIEARPLATGLGENGAHLLERVLWWTGGHPYLTQKLCRAVAAQQVGQPTAQDVDRAATREFLTEAARTAEPNLNFVESRLLRGDTDPSALLHLYEQALRGTARDDPQGALAAALRLTGVVRVDRGRLAVRNRIYERVFDRAWVTASLPRGERQRQRAAFLRGVAQTAAVASVALGLTTYLAVRAMSSEARVQRLLTDNKEQLRALVDEKVRADRIAEEAGEREAKAALREIRLMRELEDARDAIRRLRRR